MEYTIIIKHDYIIEKSGRGWRTVEDDGEEKEGQEKSVIWEKKAGILERRGERGLKAGRTDVEEGVPLVSASVESLFSYTLSRHGPRPPHHGIVILL